MTGMKENKKRISKLFETADNHHRSGDFLIAIDNYKEILELTEGDERARHIAYWGIGDCYLYLHDLENAEYHLKCAINLSPEDANYHYLLGVTYSKMTRFKDAIMELEKSISIEDSHAVVWGYLGWVYGLAEDKEKGLEYLKKAVTMDPANVRFLIDLTMLYAKNYEFGPAIVCAEQALDLDPENEEVQALTEKVEFFKEQFEKLTKK